MELSFDTYHRIILFIFNLLSIYNIQVASLIEELASAAAAEKGIVFEKGIEDRLCAYARAVSHFPTAVKEVKYKSWLLLHLT